MKKQIRYGVFETNSSSMHSLTIYSRSCHYYTTSFEIENNYVVVRPGEFGWGYDEFSSPSVKLEYAVLLALSSVEYSITSEEEFYESEEFQMLNDLIKYTTPYDGIILKDFNFKYDEKWSSFDHEGYIDHQSKMPLNMFLSEYGIDLEDFIFGDNVLIIDNDNH